MNAWLFRLIVLVAVVGFAAPAYARNWVDIGGGYWIDRDSISRNGDWVYFYLYWKDSGSPSQEGGPLSPNKAYNCVTWYYANFANGELIGGSVLEAEEEDLAALYSSVLCN